MARIERKYPSKIILLSFLNETKQQSTQTLSDYLTLGHREAAQAGLYSQGWTISDMEVIIILAGMKNAAQQQRLLLEYSDKNKITFDGALKFALVEETAESQAMKGKSSSSINSIKKGEKAKPKNSKPAATSKEPEKKKCEKCPSYRHKTEDCTSTFCTYCNRWFHTIESCKLNPNSPSYSPTFEAERNTQKKPTATIQSIQHAQQQ